MCASANRDKSHDAQIGLFRKIPSCWRNLTSLPPTLPLANINIIRPHTRDMYCIWNILQKNKRGLFHYALTIVMTRRRRLMKYSRNCALGFVCISTFNWRWFTTFLQRVFRWDWFWTMTMLNLRGLHLKIFVGGQSIWLIRAAIVRLPPTATSVFRVG